MRFRECSSHESLDPWHETTYKKNIIYKFLQSLGNLKTKVARDKTGFKLEKMVFRYSLNTEDCHGFSVFRV